MILEVGVFSGGTAYFDGSATDFTASDANWVYQEWDLPAKESQETVDEFGVACSLGQFLGVGQLIDINGTVSGLSFYLKKVGTPSGDVNFVIENTDGDTLSTATWGDAADVPSALTKESVTITPIPIEEQIRIFVEVLGGDTDNYIGVGYHHVVGGDTYRGLSTWKHPIAGWNEPAGYDCAFEIVYGSSETGSFSAGVYDLSIAGLTPETDYRVRAYAINSIGIGYGTVVTVTTGAAVHPYSWGYILGL